VTESAVICKTTVNRSLRSPNLWIIDAGATHHICFEKSLFRTFDDYQVSIQAGTSTTTSQGRGQIDLDVDGQTLSLHGVLYAPQLQFNLLSTECLRRESFIGYDSIPNTLYNGEDNSVIAIADSSSGIPIINTNPSIPIHHLEGSSTYYHEVTTRPISLKLAHRRLGHISESRVRKLASGQAEGLKLLPHTGYRMSKCDHCIAGKIKTLPHPRKQPTLIRSERPMEMLHLDLLQGPCAALTTHYEYLFVIVDDYTRMAWSIGLKTKDIQVAWERWYTMIKFQYKDVIKDFSILRLRADNGGEFIIQDMQSQWEDIGTWLQLSIAYTHNQNGVVERAIRTIVEHAVSVLNDAKMPDYLWYEVSLTITYLGNLLPHSYLQDDDDAPIPIQAFTGKKPNLSHLRVIGSKAHVLVPKEVRQHKFKPRAVIGRLVGYDGVNQYRMWVPEMNAIVWGRNITLNEDDVVYEKVGQFEEDEEGLGRLILTDPEEIKDLVANIDHMEKREGNPTEHTTVNQSPQHQDHPQQLNSTVNDLIDQFGDTGVEEGEFPQARNDDDYVPTSIDQTRLQPPLRDHPQRVRKPTRRVLDNVIHHDEIPVDDPEVFVNNVFAPMESEPTTYAEAMQRPESKKWCAAMGKEDKSLLDAGTWQPIERSKVPRNHRVLKGKWVYKIKRDGVYKARWVVKGFEQVKGLDYQQIFAAVVRADTFRTLLAIATLLDWDISNIDIDSAFLYGEIDTEVYIELPEGFYESHMCGKLLKSIYGLKQAPRIWAQTLYKILRELGLTQLQSEHSVFTNKQSEAINKKRRRYQKRIRKTDEDFLGYFAGPDLIVAVYVDDLLIIGKSSEIVRDFKRLLGKKVSMKETGDDEARDYLGIEISRDREKGTLRLSQKAYFKGVLARYCLEGLNGTNAPMREGLKFYVDDADYADDDEKSLYQSKVGSLTYGMQGTRPDIAYAVSLFSRFLGKPTKSHVKALQGVFRYLVNTLELGIVYSKHDRRDLHAYTDADWAGSTLIGDSKSTSGYVVMLAGGPIAWSSRRQATVATSSTYSEYVGQANAIKQACHLIQFLGEVYRLPNLPLKIYADNQGAQALARNPEFHAKAKHIQLSMHFQREKVENGQVELVHVATEEQAADGLTKPLNQAKFKRFVGLLNLQ
jgi:Reverse transcriptase (RNA-dependent DNA polymerase)/GAG-pre-integrase domain